MGPVQPVMTHICFRLLQCCATSTDKVFQLLRRHLREGLILAFSNIGKTPGKLWEMVVSTVIVIPLRD